MKDYDGPIGFDELEMLLFMTQTAVSDMKHLKTFFAQRKFNVAKPKGFYLGGKYRNPEIIQESSQSNEVKQAIDELAVNPVKLSSCLERMISRMKKNE